MSAEERVRTTTVSGTVSDRMLLAAFETLTSAADYNSSLAELIDLREVENLNVTNEGLRVLEKRFGAQLLRSPNRVSIVAANTGVLERAQFYKRFSWKSELIAVTRSLEDALMWLELPMEFMLERK